MNRTYKAVQPPQKSVPTPKASQPSVAAELMRGNTDFLDRIHPHLGPSVFGLSCALLVFGLWLKRKEKRRHVGDDYAGVC